MPRSRDALFSITAAALVAAACSSANIGRDASGTGGTGGGAGGSGGALTEGGAADRPTDGGGPFALTSPAFVEGGNVPTANTCGGADTSPQLDWTSGPAATKSYAVVLTDVADGTVYWAVWDIPADASSLAAMLPNVAMLPTPAGAKQVRLGGGGNGYTGPCPGGATHAFQFEVDALDVATLPNVSTTSTAAVVNAAVSMHTLGRALLTGMSDAQAP
jgi:Raf kinase inhibitor-like YbhB/YbcL family protein